jgi:hypothetical protein
MFNEDNNGFVNFPITNNKLVAIDSGTTMVYIVAFEPPQGPAKNKTPNLGNLNLFLPGIFIADDVMARPPMDMDSVSLERLIENNTEQNNYDSMYFPNLVSDEYLKRQMSVDLISSICIGWANQTFEFRDEIRFWNACFKDLSYEGRNLYYGLKKLHNQKEVRILTFNTN